MAEIALALAVVACSKSDESAAPTGATGATPRSSGPPVAMAQADSAAPESARTWSGHYTAAAGPFYVPDGGEWAGVRFRGEDASVGLGEGTLRVTVDSSGHVTGTLDGALGALGMNGELAADAFSAVIVTTDRAHGFTGTAVGTVEGNHIAGTMRLSLPTGNVIRAASFTLDRAH
jgi:hypothetical protein